MLHSAYPYRLLPQYKEKRLDNWLFAVAFVLSLCGMWGMQESFDEMVGLILMCQAVAMLSGYDRPMNLRPIHCVMLALAGVLVIGGFVNMNFGAGRDYTYPFGSEALGGLLRHCAGGYGLGLAIGTAGVWMLVAAFGARCYTKDEIRAFQSLYNQIILFFAVVLVACNVPYIGAIDRTAIRLAFLRINANLFPYFAIPVIVVYLARLAVSWSWIDFVRVLVCFGVFPICNSRGANVGLVLSVSALAVYLICISPYGLRLAGAVGAACVLFGIALAVVWAVDPVLLDSFFRFSDGSNGRFALWEEAVGFVETPAQWLFGIGWKAYYLHFPQPTVPPASWETITWYYGVHNQFVAYLTSAGVFAVALLFAVYVLFALKIRDWFVFSLLGGGILHMTVENGTSPVIYAVLALGCMISGYVRENPYAERRYIYYFLDERRQAVFAATWNTPRNDAFTRATCLHTDRSRTAALLDRI